MSVSQTYSEPSLKRLRRETHLQALRIALPAIGFATYYLILSAVFYFKPHVLLGFDSSSVWQPMQISPAVESGLSTGIPLAIVAFAVYFLAVRVLWRLKVSETP